MPDQYVFRLNSFHIFNTMALHEDTDYVYFTVKVGEQMFGPRHEKIGDLNNGTFFLNWEFGPVEIADDVPVLMTYQIVNHGHDNAAKQAQDDITIANQVAAGVGGIVGVAFPPAAVIVGAIVTALAGVGQVLKWLFGEINCDGMVLSDAVSVNGGVLRGWSQPTGTHSETRNYSGHDTPVGCGSNARYAVTWSVIDIAKAKESKEHKDKDKEHKDKEHLLKELAKEKEAVAREKQREVLARVQDSPHPVTPFDTRFF